MKSAPFPVLDGANQATIVYSSTATGYEVTAYQELASFLQKATGKTFTTISETTFNSSNAKFPIFVGNCTATQQVLGSQLANVDRDGFMIVAESKRMFIVGPKAYSTYWGVLQFLEDYVGVRWLIPGPLGEDVLPQSKILITPMWRTEQPAVLSRDWSGYTQSPYGADWTMRMRVQHRYNFHVNFTANFASYWPAHPEYFAWVNGARLAPDAPAWHTNICLTNPTTVTIAVQNATNAFTTNPDQESYSIAQDDATIFCQCDASTLPYHAPPYCSQLANLAPHPNTDYWNTYNGSAEYSDLYFNWVNNVATALKTSYPNKILGCEAYSKCTAWPANISISNSQMMPYICLTTADRYVPAYKNVSNQLIDQWSSRCNQIGMYDFAYGLYFVMPRIYTSLIQDELQYTVPRKLKGLYAEEYPNWGLDGPRVYMTAKLWWNPYIDRQAVQDDWCNRMFKEAAAPLKSHFARCESSWVNYDGYSREPTVVRLGAGNPWSPWMFTTGGKTSQYEVFTPEICAASTSDFDNAAAMAQSQTVKDRVQFFRKTWNLSLVFANAYWAGEGLNSYIARGCTLDQAANVLKKMPQNYDQSYFLGQITSLIGTDCNALYPVYGDFIPTWAAACVPKEAALADYQSLGNMLATEALAQPQAQRQSYINARCNALFGTGGTTKFQRATALIRHMAMDQLGLFTQVPQGSLLAYFRFNETSGSTASDTSNNHLMCTLVGDVNWVNDAARGRCVQLYGKQDYLYFGSLGKNLNKDISITCWTKSPDVISTMGFIEGWTNSGTHKMLSYLPLTYLDTRVIWDGGGSTDTQISILTSVLGYTSSNTWYHWAFTKNGTSGQIKLYTNGALKATSNGVTATLTDLASVTIGVMGKYAFTGLIDDVSFWSKALSDTEVANIYTNGIDVDAAPPIVWYKLNDRARNTATDFSGNSYNGTFSAPGATWISTTDPHGSTAWVLVFDGNSGAIVVPSTVPSLIGNQVTITFWQKGNTGAQCDIFNVKKSDNSIILQSRMPWVNGSNYVTWDAGSPLDTVSKVASAGNYTGTWNHWAFTKNTVTGQQKIYLNGTIWQSNTSKTSPITGGSTMQIGTGPDGFYSGSISDFRIYNAELSGDSIANIYAGTL